MRLYKYITRERLDILREGKIRFTQPGDFNDPFEMLPYFQNLLDMGQVESTLAQRGEMPQDQLAGMLEQYREMPLLMHLPDDILEEIAHISVTFATPIAIGVLDESNAIVSDTFRERIPAEFNDKIGVLCLTEKFNNLLMWAHYSNCHKGLALEFDTTHPFFDQKKSETDELRYLRKVIYNKHRPIIKLPDVTYDELCFTKSTDWGYEEEWRMVVALQDADVTLAPPPGSAFNICLFDIPADCITGIIMGARADASTQNEVIELLNSSEKYGHIELRVATLEKDVFGMQVTRRPTFSAQLLEESITDWIGEAREGTIEDYEALIKDLTAFEIYTLANLKSMVTRHINRAREYEAESIDHIIQSGLIDGDEEVLRAQYSFTYIGLTRGILAQEFGDTWEKYRAEHLAPQSQPIGRQESVIDQLQRKTLQLRPRIMEALAEKLNVSREDLEKIERKIFPNLRIDS